jgi:hypothetical protein
MNPFQKLAIPLRSVKSSMLQERSKDKLPIATGSCAEELRLRIALEYLRQARCGFNLSLVIITVGAIISFRGADMLLSGETTEGAIATIANLLTSVCHIQLTKEANERLEKSATALEDEQ